MPGFVSIIVPSWMFVTYNNNNNNNNNNNINITTVQREEQTIECHTQRQFIRIHYSERMEDSEPFHGFHPNEIPPRRVIVQNEEEFPNEEETSGIGVDDSRVEDTENTELKRKRGQRGKGKVLTDDNENVILEGRRRPEARSKGERDYKISESTNQKEKDPSKVKAETSSRPKR